MALALALSFSTYFRYSSTVVAPEEHQQMAKTKGRSAGLRYSWSQWITPSCHFNQSNQIESNQIKQSSNQSSNQAISLSLYLSLTISICFTLFHHGTKEETLFSTVKPCQATSWYIQHHPTSPGVSGTDDLHIAPRQRGFQDVGRIHGTTVATAAGTHQGVDLVDHQNDVRIVTHFLSPSRKPPEETPGSKNASRIFRTWPQHATRRKKHMFWEAKSSWAPQEWHQG